MRKNKQAGVPFALIAVIVLAVLLVAVFFITKNYAIAGWRLYPKNQAQLDLREQNISRDTYDSLILHMPGTEILWDVPFQDALLPSQIEELTLTSLQESDIPMLEYFPRLKTVDADGCTDYRALIQLYRSRPDLDIRFRIPISGQLISPDARSVRLTTLTAEEAEILSLLPNLREVDGTLCREYTLLNRLRQEHPNWKVLTMTAIAGTALNADAVSMEFTGASADELSIGLAAMPGLESVLIHEPCDDAQRLQQLRQEYPDVNILWDVEFAGTTFLSDTQELDVSFAPIGSIENAKALADKFPDLTKLIVDSAGISDEDMAAYREEVRSRYKVVWTVYFTSLCKARTDDTWFMPIQQEEYFFQQKDSYPLRYCEDMVCIDIGHSTVSSLEFVKFMPHLKYLILAWTEVTDLSPLANCKELVFLEVDNDIVHDFSPLVECTGLEDLNISCRQWDASCKPIQQMTWLKNLWMIGWSALDYYEMTQALPNTHIMYASSGASVSQGWRKLQNYYDMRDYLGMPYM